MFLLQAQVHGEWIEHGTDYATRREAEAELAFRRSTGAFCAGRDAYGHLLPDNETRIVEVQGGLVPAGHADDARLSRGIAIDDPERRTAAVARRAEELRAALEAEAAP